MEGHRKSRDKSTWLKQMEKTRNNLQGYPKKQIFDQDNLQTEKK